MAMYSGTLTIVETSLSGLGGSGARQTSAVERMRRISSSPRQPANSTTSESPSSPASARISSILPVADEDCVPVVPAKPSQCREGAERVVDAVLGPHHPEVGDQVAAPPAQFGVRLDRQEAVEVGPVADHEHVRGGDAPRSIAIRR